MENDKNDRGLGAMEEDMEKTVEERKPQVDSKKEEGCGCDSDKTIQKDESSERDSRAES